MGSGVLSQASVLPGTLRCVLLDVWSPTLLGFSEESENHPGLAQREAGAGWTAWLKAAETWDLQSGASCMSAEGRELGLLRVGDRKKIWWAYFFF